MTKTGKSEQPYWKTVPLAEMSDRQWEALCDRCGKCCLVKLEDEETGDIAFTDIICDMYDQASCGCANYARRTELVPSCVRLTPENLGQLAFMPPSCAYRLLHEGRDLPDWHPLVSGDTTTVAQAGMSVQGRVRRESDMADPFSPDAVEARIVDWPLLEKKAEKK